MQQMFIYLMQINGSYSVLIDKGYALTCMISVCDNCGSR